MAASTSSGNCSSLDGDLLRTVQAAARFYGDSNAENSSRFDETLITLIRTTSTVDPAGRLSLTQAPLVELLNYAPILISASTTNSSTRSKILRLLFNIAHHNVRLRRHFAGDLELCGPVFECLKMSLKEQLGPQNMIDILRLLQTSYKQFTKRLLKLLAHDSRIVVVSALVLIGYLEEKLRNMVYCTQNIPQTFQCVFNVLILGDSLMTRHIAADLLRRLVVSDSPKISSTPTMSSTGKDLMNYKFFSKCIQQTAGLIVQQDARIEETTKIYDVLLSLCALPTMRTPTCFAILDTPVTENRLTTPLMAIARTARLSFEEAIDPNVTVKALRLFNYLIKEAVEGSKRLEELTPEDRILSIIDVTVKSPLQTDSDQAVFQCERIKEGLRIAETVFSDEHFRPPLLEILSAPLCAHLIESQLLTNPIVTHVTKPTSQRTEKLPEWSINGVGIVLELIRVLAAFKDYSKPHKDQYWKSIKDDRLVPLLAFAISSGRAEMVHDALVLYTHCQQSHAFPSKWLGDLVSCCVIENSGESNGNGRASRDGEIRRHDSGSRISKSEEREDLSTVKRLSSNSDQANHSKSSPETNGLGTVVTSRQINELLQKMKDGMDMKDSKMSDVLAAYENKISIHTVRERELERLIAAKDAALAQSERLRIQYAASGTSGTDEADLARIRKLVTETEILRNERDDLLAEALKEKEKVAAANRALADSRKECSLLEKDCECERELVSTLKKSIDEFKGKMEKLSKAVLQLQEQSAGLTAEVESKKDEIYRMEESVRRSHEQSVILTAEIEKKKEENSRLSEILRRIQDQLNQQEIEVEKAEEEKKTHMKMIEELKRQRDEYRERYEELRGKADRDRSAIEEKKRRLREEMLKLATEFD